MADDCLFCRIVAGSDPAAVVTETKLSFAFMSAISINSGHALIVPKLHEPDFYRVPPDSYADMFSLARVLASACAKLYEPKKVGLLIAGFDVPHTHLHVLPMNDYHDITSKPLLDGVARRSTIDELEGEAVRLRPVVAELGTTIG